MLAHAVTAIVRFCTRFPWPIIALGLLLAAGSGIYAAKNFAINTDISKLISPNLEWRKHEAEFEKAFPGHFGTTIVVVDAPKAEYANIAATELAKRLKEQPQLFRAADDISGSEFFARNGLLFRPTGDVTQVGEGLGQAAPLIGTLVTDPSLRGVSRAMSLGLVGVQNKRVTLDALARPLNLASVTIEEGLAGE